jgi:hypothetical protein
MYQSLSLSEGTFDHWRYRPITKFPGGPVDKPLEEAAKRLGITTTQVIFLWLKSKGIVIVTYVFRLPFFDMSLFILPIGRAQARRICRSTTL